MQTPQKMTFDTFIHALENFYSVHANDVTIKIRTAYLSIHNARFKDTCTGLGRVWRIGIPYCMGKEPEPEGFGCLHIWCLGEKQLERLRESIETIHARGYSNADLISLVTESRRE